MTARETFLLLSCDSEILPLLSPDASSVPFVSELAFIYECVAVRNTSAVGTARYHFLNLYKGTIHFTHQFICALSENTCQDS